MDDALQNYIAEMIYQHDGCPVHSSRVVTDYLNERFGQRWIGIHGPIKWPARSPDLNPLDFYVWGRAKELVYTEEILNVEYLKCKIENAFAIMKREITIITTTAEMRRRLQEYMRFEGSHFEHL